MATARTCPSSFPIAVVLVLALRESLLAGGFVVKAPVPLQHLQQQQQQQQHSCSTVLDGSAAAAAAAVPRPTRRRCRRLGGSASLGAHDDGETPAVSTSLSGLEGIVLSVLTCFSPLESNLARCVCTVFFVFRH